MRRNSLGGLVCVLALAGCSIPRETVYVDVDRALQAEGRISALQSASPVVRFEPIAAESNLPAVAPRRIADPQASKRLEAAKDQLQQQRSETLRNTVGQLLKAYGKDVERFRLERNVEIERELQAVMDEASRGVGDALDAYAQARWSPANRLALLVGFPYPTPSRIAVPLEEDAIGRKRYAEIRDLYALLAQLEAEYQRRIEGLFAKYFESASQKRLELGLEVVERVDAAERRARAEAERSIAAINHALDLSLGELADIALPGVAGQSVRIEASSNASSAPIGAEPRSASIIERRESVENDLRVWLGAHALIRARSPGRARDATETFIKWRHSMQSER